MIGTFELPDQRSSTVFCALPAKASGVRAAINVCPLTEVLEMTVTNAAAAYLLGTVDSSRAEFGSGESNVFCDSSARTSSISSAARLERARARFPRASLFRLRTPRQFSVTLALRRPNPVIRSRACNTPIFVPSSWSHFAYTVRRNSKQRGDI
jgi:hypothetical protein